MSLVAVVLFAALSVVIAWLCAAFGALDLKQSRVFLWAGKDPSASVMPGFGRTRVNWIGPYPPAPPDPSDPPGRGVGPATGEIWAVDDCGWPFRSMRATVANHLLFVDAADPSTLWAGESGRMYIRCLRLTDEQLGYPAGQPTWRALPLQPLWAGLLGNVAAYGVPFVVAIATVRALVRWRRTRRSLCGRCGYPLGPAERCPECGAVHASRAGSSE